MIIQTTTMSIEATKKVGCTIKLPLFEGPLDLLLHLVREHKLDIYDIPIAEVTDQYLRYLWLMESLNLEIAGEFLVMAATLLEIKSRMLLPKPPANEEEEIEDPRAELVERLLEYERFKYGAELLRRYEENRGKMFWRISGDSADYDTPVMPINVEAMDLLFALQKMLQDVGEGQEEVTSVERQRITLRMKMNEVWRKIRASSNTKIRFVELFSGIRTRLEIVMTFLAVLELLRLGKIQVRQQKTLGDIEIWATHTQEQ